MQGELPQKTRPYDWFLPKSTDVNGKDNQKESTGFVELWIIFQTD